MPLSNLDLLATAPGGVSRLRELILTLAVQGKLVPQDSADEPARVLLAKIRTEKDRLIAEGKIKRDKPLPRITDVEKPFELPVGWEWVRVGQIASRVQYGVTASADHTQGAPKFVRITDIQNDRVNWDAVPGMQGVTQDFSGHYLASGDLLIARTGGTIGKSFLVSFVPVNAVFASYLIRISPAPSSNSSYLKIFASSGHYWHQLHAKSMGTGQPNVNGTALSELTLPLPPLAEQSRIVTRVEELMQLCDALEAKGRLEATQHARLVNTLLTTLTDSPSPEALAENWQRVSSHFDLLLDRPEAVDALEQTLLQLAVRGLLVPQDPQDEPASALLKRIRAEKNRLIATGQIKRDKHLPPITEEEKPLELPVGWEWVRFGEYFFELCTGPFGSVVHKEDYVEGGVPLINPSHMIGGRIFPDPSVSVSPEMSKQLGAYRLTAGDVVLARRGEVGRYALVTEAEDGWLCGTGSFFVKLHDSCHREFFGLVLEDPDLRRHLQGESVGSTMVNLNQRILVETPMALPPLAEQFRIVTRVSALRRLCADLRQRLDVSQSVQAQLAAALVHLPTTLTTTESLAHVEL